MEKSTLKVKKSTRHKVFGVLTVIGGMCVHMFIGSLYIWGNIKGYVASYFHQFSDSVTVSSAFVVLPALVITNTALMPLGSYLGRELNPKI